MHPCLEIREIGRMICAEIGAEYGATLSSLARTCHAFEKPALDVLWEKQSSLIQVFKTFPPDLWRIKQVVLKGELRTRPRMEFIRPIVAEDWSRFLTYASRIAHLDVTLSPRCSTKVFCALTIAKLSQPLFGKLRALCWKSTDDKDFPIISLLLGPTVIDVQFSLTDSGISGWSLLSSLQTSCPSIKKLKVTYDKDSTSVDTFSAHLCSWQTLDVVETEALTADAIMHLAGMPKLHSLSFKVLRTTDVKRLSRVPRRLAFPTLRSLTIRLPNASFVPSILSLGAHLPLDSITLLSNMKSTVAGWVECFEALKNHISHYTLTSLEILEENKTTSPIGDTDIIRGDQLNPLFAFAQVTEMWLNPRCHFELDDALIKEMAESWPNLETLNMGNLYGCGGLSKITLPGLIPLITHCPYLRHIGIVLDATKLERLPLVHQRARISNAVVKSIYVGDSPISHEVLKIAAFLSDILPGITHIQHIYHSPTPPEQISVYQDRWKQVVESIPHFAEVREQERCRTRPQTANGL